MAFLLFFSKNPFVSSISSAFITSTLAFLGSLEFAIIMILNYSNQRFSLILENPSILGTNVDAVILIALCTLNVCYGGKTR